MQESRKILCMCICMYLQVHVCYFHVYVCFKSVWESLTKDSVCVYVCFSQCMSQGRFFYVCMRVYVCFKSVWESLAKDSVCAYV